MRRQPRSDHQIDAHDSLRLHAGDVDDVLAVEDGGGTRLVERGGDLLHERLRHVGHVNRGQIGEPEVEDARRQGKQLGALDDVTEVAQGEQVAARHRARQAGALGDVGDGQLARVGAKHLDDREAALEALNEFLV